jgi:hypothetical protein
MVSGVVEGNGCNTRVIYGFRSSVVVKSYMCIGVVEG